VAFPSARSASNGTQGTNSNSWTVTYPATIAAGDLILLNCGIDGNPTPSATGFTVLKSMENSAQVRGATLYKIADGTESGNFTLSLTASEQGVWSMVAIQDWHGIISGGCEVSTGASGSSSTPDPDSLTPSWGADDTYWIAVCALGDGRYSVSAYPTNYGINQFGDASGGAQGGGLARASRQLNATSDNPGTFTWSGINAWVAYTIAIRPGAPPPLLPALMRLRVGPNQAVHRAAVI